VAAPIQAIGTGATIGNHGDDMGRRSDWDRTGVIQITAVMKTGPVMKETVVANAAGGAKQRMKFLPGLVMMMLNAQTNGRIKGEYRGKGPKGYTRSDERIKEDVNDRLSDDPQVDASDISVTVSGCEVTLTGTVSERGRKGVLKTLQKVYPA
jgi:hypothetical protein